MYQNPIGYGPILDPASFAAFTSDVTFGFAVWLGVAAIAHLAVLPLAFRRHSSIAPVETVSTEVDLPEAA
jgi:hypothetical protein